MIMVPKSGSTSTICVRRTCPGSRCIFLLRRLIAKMERAGDASLRRPIQKWQPFWIESHCSAVGLDSHDSFNRPAKHTQDDAPSSTQCRLNSQGCSIRSDRTECLWEIADFL